MKAGDKLALTRTTVATTYHFRPADPTQHGWALCTVNDSTGELLITSDWGDWSYRWNVQHIGSPSGTGEPLTRFLADREPGSCHYIADKLTSSDRSKRAAFDGELTVAGMREYLVERFRDNGGTLRKIQKANIFASTLESDRWVPMSRREFAVLYKALGTLEHIDDQREFVDAFYEIEHHEAVTTEPWEHSRSSPTSSYLVLLHTIIPALVAACTERVRVLPPIPAAAMAVQETATS